ncbi:MAG: glycosyltransferase family 39 protein, partial [Phycisphaerales bacterium]
IVPIAASIRLFGDSPAVVALPMVVASTLCVALVAILGRIVWGWWEGLCAATVVSVLPYFRVLSTTAYPDVHACLWTTVAILLAVALTRERRMPRALLYGAACGLALGLAASAKIFSVSAGIGVVFIIWIWRSDTRYIRTLSLTSVVLGCMALFLIQGLFYLWVADDFWFKLHALRNAQSADHLFTASGTAELAGFAELAWNRLTLILAPGTSGWGLVAIAFWPAAGLVLLLNRPGRGLAVWAIAAYLFLALTPVRMKGGLQPYPFFDGRAILTACVPFALCLGWLVHRMVNLTPSPSLARRGWPVVFAVIIALAFTNLRELNGFRDRPTKRLGDAVKRLVAITDWDDQSEIFMPASLYLRYRILFPANLRSRLRVAIDDEAQPWWRNASVDIVSRRTPLPGPGNAYLIATPLQLTGVPESWDYGVPLPRAELRAWEVASPVFAAVQSTNDTSGTENDEGAPLLVLLTGDRLPRACSEHPDLCDAEDHTGVTRLTNH